MENMDTSNSDLNVLLNRLEISCITDNFLNYNFNIDKEYYRRTTSYNYECIKDIDMITKYMINHEYDKILNTEFSCWKSLKEQTEDIEFVSYAEDGEIKSNYLPLFHSTEEDLTYIKQLILLFTAVAALQEFVKANICGPTACLENEYTILDRLLPNSGYSDECVFTALSKNSEVILTKIIHPKLLFFSLMLLQSNNFDNCLTQRWWLIRSTMIHQRILPDRVADLHCMVTNLIAKQLSAKFLKNKEEPLAEIMFYIECANAHLYYKEFNIAEKYIISAQNILGFGVKLNRGPITQSRRGNGTYTFFVELKRNDSRYRSKLTLTQHVFPPYYYDCSDTFLDCIIATDNNGERITDLLPEEQIILLTYCDLISERGAKMYMEEVLSIASILLLHPKNWAIQCKALFVATRNQVSPFIEREKCHNQINQIKQLLTCINNNTPQFSLRQNLLYSVSFPMKYTLEKLIADMFLILGDFENALQLYEKYNLWRGFVKCYKKMSAIREGARFLKTQINNRPISILWCYLGDLTGSIKAYKKAWNLSGNSNARCQRNLGYYFYNKQRYERCIYHFKKTLSINSLQPKVLYVMGLAAVKCNDIDVCMKAFTTLVKIDRNYFEAWECLMKLHIIRNEKTEAYRCLLQCTRDNTNYDYWGNYLIMYTRMNSFMDVIDCYNKFLDYGVRIEICKSCKVGEAHIEILSSLVDAISNGTPDNHNIPSTHLKPAALSLFEKLLRIGHVGCTSGEIQKMYADLMS